MSSWQKRIACELCGRPVRYPRKEAKHHFCWQCGMYRRAEVTRIIRAGDPDAPEEPLHPTRGRKTASDEEIIEAFQRGMFLHQIVRELHVGPNRLRAVLDREGLRG